MADTIDWPPRRPRRRGGWIVLIVALAALCPAYGQSRDRAMSVSAGPDGAARITLSGGRSVEVNRRLIADNAALAGQVAVAYRALAAPPP